MHKEPDDVEDMVAALYNHFTIIKKTSYKARTKDNSKGMGTLELL